VCYMEGWLFIVFVFVLLGCFKGCDGDIVGFMMFGVKIWPGRVNPGIWRRG
jgi:hypothetical protein